MVLCSCDAMRGTEIGYAATRWISSYALCSYWLRVSSAICLRSRYAMSGTDITHGAMCLGFCYAMSGTDIPYAGARSTCSLNPLEDEVSTRPIALRARYAMSGTDLRRFAARQ
eukprot:1851262-Rhodomonas_salina.1